MEIIPTTDRFRLLNLYPFRLREREVEVAQRSQAARLRTRRIRLPKLKSPAQRQRISQRRRNK